MRTKPIKPGTLKYLNNATEFFKKKYNLDSLSCKIEFNRHRDTVTSTKYFKNIKRLGSYDPVSNVIRIEGCEYHSRNQLIRTLFHELTHYWQTKIVKTLTYVMEFKNQQIDTLSSDQSLIKDYYHAYPVFNRTYYNQIATDNIMYWDRPHEIEARKVAQELFEEWNVPEHKGK